jgi:hypothetical protein
MMTNPDAWHFEHPAAADVIYVGIISRCESSFHEGHFTVS